jgi:hypothetical protein
MFFLLIVKRIRNFQEQIAPASALIQRGSARSSSKRQEAWRAPDVRQHKELHMLIALVLTAWIILCLAATWFYSRKRDRL